VDGALDPDEVTLRAYEPGDEHAIQAMFNDTFGDRRMAEWMWRFLDYPMDTATIMVLAAGPTPIGHAASIRFPTFIEGQRHLVGMGADLMIVPEQRGKGHTHLFYDYLNDHADWALRVSFPADVVMDMWRGSSVETDVVMPGRLPQWIRWQTPGAVERSRGQALNPAMRPVVSAGLALADVVGRSRAGRVTVEEVTEFGPEFDDLAEASARWAPCIRVRDAAYLGWRWRDNPGGRWHTWAARKGDGGLAGWITFGVRHDDLPGMGRITDCLVEDEATTTRLLAFAADRLATDFGTDHVAFDTIDPRPWAKRAYYRAGFLPRGLGPNITLWSFAPAAAEPASRLENWYFTLSDSDLV
jgi:hypothetical protein